MAHYATWGILALLGAGALVMALDFGWGGGPQIGSAPLPVALSTGLVIVSILGLVTPADEEAFGPDWRPFGAVVVAVILFILTVDVLGMIPTVLLSMTAAYLGQSERRYAGFIAYALCFGAGVWILFTIGLGLPVPAFGS